MSNKRIKPPSINNKVSKTQDNLMLGYPVFCFRHVTKQKKYCMEYFNKKIRDKCDAYDELFKKIRFLQSMTWADIHNLPKIKGIETLYASKILFRPDGLPLSSDEKIISMRFSKQKYRILGKKSNSNKDVFHILGFDFDYSAYDHGS